MIKTKVLVLYPQALIVKVDLYFFNDKDKNVVSIGNIIFLL